jgi:hypothetical protein
MAIVTSERRPATPLPFAGWEPSLDRIEPREMTTDTGRVFGAKYPITAGTVITQCRRKRLPNVNRPCGWIRNPWFPISPWRIVS